MFQYDQSHRAWQMTPVTQSNLTLGVVLAAALAVLISLLDGAGPNIWDQLRPDGVAHRMAIVRF